MDAAARRVSDDSSLDFAKHTVRHEANALLRLADQLDSRFMQAIQCIEACSGSILVTGMGKAGLIGQKISATFCSTGTRSFFLHPSEAIHGDLGRVRKEDIVIVLSMSGETEELARLLPSLQAMSGGLIAITSQSTSTLGKRSNVVIELGQIEEADTNGLAPSSSTTAMLAIGDALALTLSHRRGFGAKDFVKFHPGGSLGRKLTCVSDIMRPIAECRVANANQSVRETFVTLRRQGRRTGAVMIVDEQGQLVGLFTDSDLARLLETGSDKSLDAPVNHVMTHGPFAIRDSSLMPEAIRMLAEHQISELPVISASAQPVGLIDITDLIDWVPSTSKTETKLTLLPFPPAHEEHQR